jgi:hypothetical protein
MISGLPDEQTLSVSERAAWRIRFVLGSAITTSPAYLANSSATSRLTDVAR